MASVKIFPDIWNLILRETDFRTCKSLSVVSTDLNYMITPLLTNLRSCFSAVIACGARHNLVLSDNKLYFWGGNQSDIPEIPGTIQAIACGEWHNLVLSDNKLYTWGSNYFSQLDIPEISGIIQVITCGGSHNLVLSDNTKL